MHYGAGNSISKRLVNRRIRFARLSEQSCPCVYSCGGQKLTEIPDTRDSLLVRVRDPSDQEAWEQFAGIYRPVAYRLARARGMQDADAEELAQSVLMKIARAIPSWESTSPQGRFRHWLRRVAKNAVINALSRRPKDQALGGSEMLNLLDEQCVGGPGARQN